MNFNISYFFVVLILVLALFISFTSQEDFSITGYQIQNPPPGSDQLACPSSMISYWILEEGTGNWFSDLRDVHDLYFFTSRGNDAWWIQGLVGYAVNVYANGEWFGHNFPDSSYSFGADDSFTIEFLFRTSARPPGVVPQNILNKKDYDQASNVWRGYTLSYLDSGKLSFTLYDDGTGASLVTQRTFADGDWHHVVAVRKAGRELLWYVDGVLDASGPDTSRNTYIPTQKVVFFGGPTRQWIGNIDEIAIYNEALTPEAIQAHSAKTKQYQHYCRVCTTTEICTDNTDNNCDGQINEGCCGNNICDSPIETACTCSIDCTTSICGDGCVTGNEQCEQNTDCSSQDNQCQSCACVDCDKDDDAYYGSQCGGNDCNDNSPNINPGLSESCNDLLDNNCNGLTDCVDPSCINDNICQSTAPIHISYYDQTNRDLKYARYVGSGGNCGPQGDWQCDTIDSLGSVGFFSSLAINSYNLPSISYNDDTQGWNNVYLKYARYVGSGGNCGPNADWQCDIIDSGRLLGYPSTAFDANNIPFILYIKEADLKYAKHVGPGNGNCGPNADWQCDTITQGINYPNSLAFDSTNLPSAAYIAGYNPRGLQYAHYITVGNGNCGPNADWQCDTIDFLTDYYTGDYSALEFDSQNTAHIGYLLSSPNFGVANLKYARYVTPGNGNCGPNADWQCDTIDSLGLVGYNISIALDANDIPSMSYHEEFVNDGDLKYAKHVGVGGGGNCGPRGDWQCDTIDSVGDVGSSTSLDISSSNLPMISYPDTTNGDLKYARYVSSGGNCGPRGDWQCDTIDSVGDVGYFNSMKVI